LDPVLDHGLALARSLETHDESAVAFMGGIAPRAVDPERAPLRLGALALGGELFLAHPALVGMAACEQLVRHFGMASPELRLVVFVPVPIGPEPAHPVEDRLDRILRRARLVGVLEPQEEAAAVAPGIEPIEQRGPRAADMEKTGRRGRKAGHDRTSSLGGL